MQPDSERTLYADFPKWDQPCTGWLPIVTLGALDAEALEMNNGVAEYFKDVYYGSCRAFRVLEPERATAVLWFSGDLWVLHEIWGRGGVAVRPATRQRVEEWLEGAG